MFVKTNCKDAAKAIAAVQGMLKRYCLEYPFSYSFIDEDYDALYKTEQRTGMLFNVFSIVALLTVSMHAGGAALGNPVKNLKEE
jgi:putative ABC transport system permease protein